MGAASSSSPARREDLLESSLTSVPDLPDAILKMAVEARDEASSAPKRVDEPSTSHWTAPLLQSLGLLLAPGLLLASWALGPTLSWTLIVAAAAPMCVFCAWSVCRRQDASLNPEAGPERRSTTFRGSWLVLINGVILALLYMMWSWQLLHLSISIPLLRLCLQSLAMFSELAVTLYASVGLARCIGFAGYIPVVVHVLLLPFLDTQRMPFAFEGAWPQWFDHAAALMSLILSPIIIRSPAVRICLEPGKLVGQGRRFCLEHLQSLCSFLCFSYLLVASRTEQKSHGAWWNIVCHILWSFLRASLITLFGLYWLEAPVASRPCQSLMSLLGLSFFLIYAPLVDAGTLEGSARFRISQIANADLLGEGSKRIEQLCFLVMLVLFFMRGLSRGKWRRASDAVGKGFGIFAMILFGTVSLAALAQVCSVLNVAGSAAAALLLHGGYGHCVVVLATAAMLETALVETFEVQQCWLELEEKSGACVLPK